MWGEEHTSRTCIDVVAGYIDATVFDMQVYIGIDNRVVTALYARMCGILCGKLTYARSIVGFIVVGEVTYVATHLHTQYLGYAEQEV